MAKKKSGNKKKRASTKPQQANLSENTDATAEDTNVNEAEAPQDLPSVDIENISDSVLTNNTEEEKTANVGSNISVDDVKDVISAGGKQENPEPEDFVADEMKLLDISEIESEPDASTSKTEEPPVDSADGKVNDADVDISDAKTKVVDNTAVEDESNPITSDDINHPDDEESKDDFDEANVIDEVEEDGHRDTDDHPDDEPPIVIEQTDDATSGEIASKADVDVVGNIEQEKESELEDQSRIAEEQRIVEQEHIAAEEKRIAEELKHKVEEETRLAEELLKKVEEENRLAEEARVERERSLKAQEESRLAEAANELSAKDASDLKDKAPQDSAKSGTGTLYSLSELMIPQDGVDWANRETYLKDDEFLLHFEMDKTAFATLPKWKQIAAKKKVGIF